MDNTVTNPSVFDTLVYMSFVAYKLHPSHCLKDIDRLI